MNEQHVVVIEAVSISAVGTKLRQSAPVASEREALDLLARILDGQEPELHTPFEPGQTLRLSEREYLDRSTSGMLPKRQTRLSVARVVATRT